jgi:hypothetical protein
MIEKEFENDRLKGLFERLPEEELPASFRDDMMKRILAESARAGKRSEWAGLIPVILASLAILGLAVGALIYAGVPHFAWRMPVLAGLPFYSHIGGLILVLLGLDGWFRRVYRKKHPN